MASLSNDNKKGYRIQWRFVVRVGPQAGETIADSLLLGRCTALWPIRHWHFSYG